MITNVNDIKKIEARGPWNCKSGGALNVLFAIGFPQMQKFFTYRQDDLTSIPPGFEIRGLRSYTVRDIPKGRIGGTEFHRIRQEMVFCLDGTIRWECEDLLGEKKEIVLTSRLGIWMPPYILHTYHSLEDKNGLFVVCNTMFDPLNKTTHDTYSLEEFHGVQKKTKKEYRLIE